MKINTEHDVEFANGMVIQCTLEFDYYLGEPEVRYYADGGGYPGSPSTCEYLSVCCNTAKGDDYEVDGIINSDWFDLLDVIIHGMIDSNKGGLRDRLTEEAIEQWEDGYDDFDY